MKKKIITVVILLLTTTAINYAGIYKQSENESSDYSNTGSLFENDIRSEESVSDDNGGGLFRAPADDPGGRPGNGGGIGQRAPIGEGIHVLVACCVILAAIKVSKKKKKEGDSNLE
jgi:hypothetical protein